MINVLILSLRRGGSRFQDPECLLFDLSGLLFGKKYGIGTPLYWENLGLEFASGSIDLNLFNVSNLLID